MDLRDIIEETSDEGNDPCRCHALMNLDEQSRIDYPFSLRRGGKERKVILVVNDLGQAEYKTLHPDGHIGAIED